MVWPYDWLSLALLGEVPALVSTALVAALLLAVAIGTYCWQSASWKLQQAADLAPPERDFYRRRHRRRLQISLLLGGIALAMVVGVWITQPLVVGFYWVGVLLLLLWVILLAMADASSSHAFFTRARARQLAEQASLEREMMEHARRRSADRNGQANPD